MLTYMYRSIGDFYLTFSEDEDLRSVERRLRAWGTITMLDFEKHKITIEVGKTNATAFQAALSRMRFKKPVADTILAVSRPPLLETVKLLIRADLGNSQRFEVDECWHTEDEFDVTTHIHEDWWIVNANSTDGDPVMDEIDTFEEAELLCGLFNLLDTDVYDEIRPYMVELMPDKYA